MAFDFFTQPQGPNIDINLYPNAASAGINAGNAQKTPLQQVVQGIGAGLDLYGKYQGIQEQNLNLEIKQNQVDQLPIQNQIQIAQAQNAETVAQINTLKLDVETKNHQLQLEAAKSELEAAKAKTDEEFQNITQKKQFEEQFNSMDPENQVGMIFSGEYNSVFSKYPEVYKRALGTAYRAMTPEQRESAAASLDFLRKIELDNQREKLNASFNQKLLENFDKTVDKVSQGPLRDIMKGQKLSTFVENTDMYPAGVKQFDKDGNLIKEATNGKPAPGGGYEVIQNGKLSPYSSLVKESDYQEFNALKDSYARFFGQSTTQNIQPQTSQSTQQQQQQAPTTAAPKGLELFAQSLKELGLPPQQTAGILERTQPELAAASESAKNATLLDRVLATVVPGFIDKPAEQMVGSEGGSLKTLIKDTSTTLADSTYKKFSEGTPDEREAVRDWAETNGVRTTYSSIKNYYQNKIQSSLSQAYQDAWDEGIAEKAKEQRTKNAAQKIQTDAMRALEGKSVDEVLNLRKQTAAAEFENSPNLHASDITPEHVSERTGIQGKQAAQIAATAKKVVFNPVFQDAPVYVKAVGAVESGGNSMSVSPTGVRGPMQVTKAVAGQYGLNRNIPEQNVLAGQMYLEDLIRTFNGNRELAYAAYNAGPKVVQYAQKLAGGSEDWQNVKKYIYKALQHYEDSIGVNALDKLKEVFNYPERVVTFEQVFT